jgi:choline dehydrogenase
VLGGSSSINAMIWNRGHPSDYDAWEAAGATGWSFATALPYFKRAEDWEGGETPWRGAGGPLRIERPRDPHPIARAMREAAAALGVPVIDDMNGPSNEGASFPNLHVVNGVRWSVSRGYLRPVMGRANLTIVTNSLATKLGFESGRCASVTHLVDGLPRVTYAGRKSFSAPARSTRRVS